MADPADARSAKLHMIAATLGVPAESFFRDTEAEEGLAGAGECLRLWHRLRTADDRRRALEYLRELANDPRP